MIIFHYFNKEYCPIMTLWTNNLHFSATFVKVLDKLILHYRTFQNNWASFQYNKQCGICRECWDNDTLCVNISMQGLWVFLFVRPYINVTSGILFIPFWSDTPSPPAIIIPPSYHCSILPLSSQSSCVCNPVYIQWFIVHRDGNWSEMGTLHQGHGPVMHMVTSLTDIHN